jgi:hypothetical protein
MRTKFNNSELSHIWANQTQSHGTGSNMFFEHQTIYSYGYHFKLAQFVNNKEGQRCVLINLKSYSNTTSKHQSLVWRAIPQDVPFLKVVSFFTDIDASSTAHKENLIHYINEAERLQSLTIKATKLKISYLSQLKNQIDVFDKYCTFFTLDNLEKFNPISGQGLTIKERYELINSFIWGFENSEELKKWKIKQEENKKKAEAKALIDAKEKIELFRQFKISSIYANLGHYLLRYNKETDNVETSGGVKMPKHIFLTAYQRLLKNELIKGQHVGDFRFNGVDDDIVSVGCHKIPMTEIKDIVAVL